MIVKTGTVTQEKNIILMKRFKEIESRDKYFLKANDVKSAQLFLYKHW